MKNQPLRKASDSTTPPQTQKPPQIIGWSQAMEYEIKGSWLTWAFFSVQWKWVRRLCGWWITRRFTKKYARYVAMKSSVPVNPPRQ